MDARDVADLEDKEYEDLIVANAHPPARNPEVWTALTHPDNLARTYDVITNVHQRAGNVLRKRKAERDLFQTECFARGEEGKREWFATRAEYESWRKRAANFHQMIQRAISELGRVKRSVNRSANHRVAQEQRETLRMLALAVHRHQAAHAREGGVAAQSDYELWRMLDRLTVPVGADSEQVTLRTMLDIYWSDVRPVDEGEGRRAEAELAMRSAPAGKSGRYGGVPRARHVHNGKELA
ncbi:hypothetical protein [Streptomyces sp. NPDC007369]|uniref:hypothetical protein n=1 Tax=Streptomyces sp. NPDC007369 TaxID=3154589 RepID=UPI0033C272FA